MSHQHTEHGEHEHCGCGHSHGKQSHRDWRMWVAVVLMLIAMAIYLLTLDNAVVHGGQPESGVSAPAATTPAE